MLLAKPEELWNLPFGSPAQGGRSGSKNTSKSMPAKKALFADRLDGPAVRGHEWGQIRGCAFGAAGLGSLVHVPANDEECESDEGEGLGPAGRKLGSAGYGELPVVDLKAFYRMRRLHVVDHEQLARSEVSA